MNKKFVYQVGNNKKSYTMLHGQPNIKTWFIYNIIPCRKVTTRRRVIIFHKFQAVSPLSIYKQTIPIHLCSSTPRHSNIVKSKLPGYSRNRTQDHNYDNFLTL